MAAHDQHATGTLVGISFPTPFRAQEFLTAVTGLAAKEKLVLKDAVTIVKNADGKVLVHETIDPTPGRSALSGAMWIGLVGLVVGGPVAWVAGAAIGAGAGAITAKVVDIGISDEWVAWFRDAVQPDTATLAILVDDFDRNALVAEAARFPGAELVYTSLDELTLGRIKDALGQQTEVLHGDLSGTSAANEPGTGSVIEPEG